MTRQMLLSAFLLFCVRDVNAQYDTLWIGTPNGVSTNEYNTTYPNTVGMAGKTHYILHSDELIDAGLEPDDVITGICMTVVDDDPIDPACVMDIHFGLKNCVQPAFDSFDEPFNAGFIYLKELLDTTLSAGLLCFTATEPPWFQWTGPGMGFMLEFTFERGSTEGTSPRVLLRTDLPENRTWSLKVDYPMLGYHILPMTPGVDMGLENSVPVVGLLVQSQTDLGERSMSSGIMLFPSPATDHIRITTPIPRSQLRVLDARGSEMLNIHGAFTDHCLRVNALAPGVYVLEASALDGRRSCHRFVKE